MTDILKATIPATEVRTIKSSKTHQEYRISVALPNSYASRPRKRYLTIYLLDANWFFGMVTDLSRIMARGPGLPEAIVVGIGYPIGDVFLDAADEQVRNFRIRDLTPAADKKMKADTARFFRQGPQTGGAGKFLKFIQTELIPLIEADYRATSTGRVLLGHSAGGLFALYAMFQQPKLFRGYVTADASLGFRDRAMFDMEGRFARGHKTLPARLYMGVGELAEVYPYSDMVSIMIQFAARLESRHYRGFTLTKQIHAGCDHGSVIAPAFQAGLQAVLG